MTTRLLSHPPEAPALAGRTLRAVVSSLPSDSHTWNLVYIELVLRELGHEVHNLGPCVPRWVLARECRRLRPDLVVLSTVNGHGATEGPRALRALRRGMRLRRTPVVIGGQLTTSGRTGPDVSLRLRAAGFTAVFADGDVARFRAFVRLLAVRAA